MHPSRWRPYPDTPFVLRELRRRGVKTGIVSNIALDIRPLFATHGLDGLIDAFALSFEHGIAKPAPALFAAACRDLGVAPAQTLMVGDDPVTDGGAAAARTSADRAAAATSSAERRSPCGRDPRRGARGPA